jgi:hypothetical protein
VTRKVTTNLNWSEAAAAEEFGAHRRILGFESPVTPNNVTVTHWLH